MQAKPFNTGLTPTRKGSLGSAAVSGSSGTRTSSSGVSSPSGPAGAEQKCFAPDISNGDKGVGTTGAQSPKPGGPSKTPAIPATVQRRDENLVEGDFNETLVESHQLQKRVVNYGANLPFVNNDAASNMARINAILVDPNTQPFFAHGRYSNSYTLDTSSDQQMGTTLGGLAGCTILVAHNHGNLYISRMCIFQSRSSLDIPREVS